jgi:replication initiation and membrane attachment protein DnaB
LHSVAKEGFNFMEAGLWGAGKKYFNRLMQAGLIHKTTEKVFHERFELSSEMHDLNQIRKKTNEFKFNRFKKKLFKAPKRKLLPAKTKHI